MSVESSGSGLSKGWAFVQKGRRGTQVSRELQDARRANKRIGRWYPNGPRTQQESGGNGTGRSGQVRPTSR